jgi:hypothetical protein
MLFRPSPMDMEEKPCARRCHAGAEGIAMVCEIDFHPRRLERQGSRLGRERDKHIIERLVELRRMLMRRVVGAILECFEVFYEETAIIKDAYHARIPLIGEIDLLGFSRREGFCRRVLQGIRPSSRFGSSCLEFHFHARFMIETAHAARDVSMSWRKSMQAPAPSSSIGSPSKKVHFYSQRANHALWLHPSLSRQK